MKLSSLFGKTSASLGLAGTLLMTGCDSQNNQPSTETLAQQAIVKSAGEDRIWGIKEKRDFLDKFGLTNNVLQENTYFLFHFYSDHANVIGVIGDIRYSFDLGSISREQLLRYIKEE